MRRVAIVLAVMALSASGCNQQESGQSKTVTAKVAGNVNPAQMNDEELAFAFLRGIQNGDKKLMYEVSNLTPELVEDSRNKLTHRSKYKQSKKEWSETEHALRMSGSIDFFLKKLKNILPKSAQLELIKERQDASGENPKNVYDIKIIYSKKEDAMLDKNGKKVKEMVVQLHQVKHTVAGRTLQEFVFDNKDFERMADRDFVVLSYY